MESSFISSSHHIDFDSVFGIEDAGLVQMFETLIATGLKEFLGCPSVFYETALTEFFTNSSVRDGVVAWFFDAVTRERFMLMTAITYDVKVNWGSLLFGVLKDMVTPGSRQAKGFTIQICVLLKNVPGLELCESRGFPVSRVLTEKTVHRYVTINEKFGGEEVIDAPKVKHTPAKKAVSKKRPTAVDVEVAPVVKKKRTPKGRPVAVAQEAVPLHIIEATADAPSKQSPMPKRKSQKRQRRLILEAEDAIADSEPVTGETNAAQTDAEVGGEAIVEGSAVADVQVEQRKEPVVETVVEHEQVAETADANIRVEKVVERVDEQVPESAVADVEPVGEQPAVETVEEGTADDVDHIIQQVLVQLDSVTTTDSGDQPAGTDAETIPWFDLPFVLATRDSERLFETASNSEDDMDPDVGNQALPEVRETDVILETNDVSGTTIGSDVGNQQLQIDADDSRADATIDSFIFDPDEEMEPVVEEQSADEAMYLEDILMSIPVKVPLPSSRVEITKITMGKEIKIPGVDERTWYLASLPQIPVNDKGKELLVEKDPVKGNPVKEQILLILAVIECLVKIREKVIDEVAQFFYSFSLKRLSNLKIDESYLAKEELVLTWAEAESTGVALNRNDINSFVLEELKKETQAHGLTWKKTCCSNIFEGRPRDRGAVIARTNTNTPSRELLPVGSINFCRSLPVVQPVSRFTPRQPTVFALRLSQFCTVFIRYSLFSRLSTVDITSFVASIASERTVLRSVQIPSSSAVSPHIPSVASTDFVSQRVPMELDQRPFSSSSSDASMNFDDNDIATTAFSLPAAATPDVTEALAQLQASIDQIRDRDGDAKLKDTLLMHLHGIEQRFTARLDDQDRVLGALLKDSHSQKQLLLLDIKSSHKQLSTQVSAAAMDTMDVRRVAKELEAKVISLDEQVAATRNDQLYILFILNGQ
ncbi:delphilin-like [Dorcoceras hygrometricum]|uniref:Delphilin-like n=1 Tax=Dorcoceras hygrometricum TaxID=472368 RepID=A0A2Z7A918_9LAMI|nr:delphilin-like [Dorcoceras hygrometricum]